MKRLDEMDRTELYELIRKVERERDELASFYCVKDVNKLRAKHWREAAEHMNDSRLDKKGELCAVIHMRADAIERGDS